MTETKWVEVLGLIAVAANTSIREVMEWPLPAVQVYIDRVMPLLSKDK